LMLKEEHSPVGHRTPARLFRPEGHDVERRPAGMGSN
jgi:hypothetical protein